MPFLGPWFLMGVLGVAGAAIPIILHFFFRSRYRVVPWAAMEFLLASIEQTSRRLKFQELLLLLLRCALLLLLAFALARPALTLFAGSSGRDAVDAVFLVDTSFSMGAREGAQTRFELAKAAALNAIDQLPPHSSVQIFTFGTVASEPLLRDSGNLDQARLTVAGLELTQQATDLDAGLAAAVSTLENIKSANKELYVFSDMQRLEFAQNAAAVKAQFDRAKSLATIYLVRSGHRTLANAAVVEVLPQTSIPRPGQRVGFAVVVRNTSTLPVRQLQVGLAVDGAMKDAEMQTIPELAEGETRVVAMTARFDKPGHHIVTGFVNSDDVPGDNALDQIVLVRDKVKVLVVDGNLDLRDPGRSSSFFLVNALVPVPDEKKADYYLQAEVIAPRQAGGELLKDKNICILVNVPLAGDPLAGADAPTSEFTDALTDFVRKGGGLLIYGGEKVSAEAYNMTLGSAGLLPVPLTEAITYPLTDPVAMDRKSASLPGFEHFKSDPHYEMLNVFPIVKSLGQQEPGSSTKDAKSGRDSSAARVVFRYTNGKPAIVTRKVGMGEVMFVGTSADPGSKPRSTDPTWNWLPRWGHGYYPLVEAKVNYLLNGQSQSHNWKVGEQIHYVPGPDTALRSFLLIEPKERGDAKKADIAEDRQTPLGPAQQTEGGGALVVSPVLVRAGVYWLTTRENDPADREPFAVAPDLRESADLQTLPDADIDRLLGFAPVHVTAREEVATTFAADRTNREWTTWLLWLVLTLAVGETSLAWFCGRAW